MNSVLLDTNVWLDYHGVRKTGAEEALSLVNALLARGCRICVSPAILKDVYYLVCGHLKKQQRAEGRTVSESYARAANELAWGCVRQMLSITYVVGIERRECERALQLKDVHGDFEDDLVLATAEAGDVDCLVTNDRSLRKHSTIRCASTREMLDILKSV